MAKLCASCGTEVLEKYSQFKCPGCGKETIIRCSSCRILTTKYKCGSCGFVGP